MDNNDFSAWENDIASDVDLSELEEAFAALQRIEASETVPPSGDTITIDLNNPDKDAIARMMMKLTGASDHDIERVMRIGGDLEAFVKAHGFDLRRHGAPPHEVTEAMVHLAAFLCEVDRAIENGDWNPDIP